MFDPKMMQAIQKQIQMQEARECPSRIKRYLKNIWDAVCNRKNVVIVQVQRGTVAMPLPPEVERELNKHAQDIFEELLKNAVDSEGNKVHVEQEDDGLEIFKRAFSSTDDGAAK